MIYIINFGSTKTPAIQQVVESLEYACEVISWEQPEKIDHAKATAFILSGAPVLLTEMDHKPYTSKYTFLKDTSVPVLGICFGHQLLGLLFGATIYKGNPVRTTIGVEILKSEHIFMGLRESSGFAQDHTEGITLPPKFIRLAKSPDYAIEAMKHPTKNIYGVQFHPEVSGKNGVEVFRNFLRQSK